MGRVATTGSLSAALVVFTKQLALAATKAAPIPDEKAEEGTVQATLGKRPFMIAPSSTIDRRSDLAFHLSAIGEALVSAG